MKVQSLRASSGMSLFTSVYGFNRVALVEEDQLYVSKNLTLHLGKKRRDDPQTNQSYLELVLVFIISAIAKAYPEAIPPKRRERYRRIFTPDVRLPTAPMYPSNLNPLGSSSASPGCETTLPPDFIRRELFLASFSSGISSTRTLVL